MPPTAENTAGLHIIKGSNSNQIQCSQPGLLLPHALNIDILKSFIDPRLGNL